MAAEGTGAIVKCYKNPECTTELEFKDAVYLLRLGPKSGFNGTDGDYLAQHIYLKNIGDSLAYNVSMQEIGDITNYFKLSYKDQILQERSIYIDTLSVNEIADITITSSIPSNVPTENDEQSKIENYINLVIQFESVPLPEGLPYFVEGKELDQMKLKRLQTIDGKVNEEFTIVNPLNSADIEMRAPIKIYHGAEQELYWDDTSTKENKYKMRLKCESCGSWSSWFDRDTFNENTQIICPHCGLPIKGAANIWQSSTDTLKEVDLTRYKLAIPSSSWVYNQTLKYYTIQFNLKGIVLDIYKFDSNVYKKVDINIIYSNNHIILESISPFEGYLLAIAEESPKENNLPKTGRAYGFGAYGRNEMYGQETLVHITDNLLVELPIRGQKTIMIDANYAILIKYRGKEATIEDIQSYYTDRYMALGCYDGPALPLWLEKGAEDV